MTSWSSKLDGMQSDYFQKSMQYARTESIHMDSIQYKKEYEYYDKNVAVRNATAYAFALQQAVLDGDTKLGDLAKPARDLAALWEDLADTSDKTDLMALMNAAVCYRLAGYQANSACIAKNIPADAESLESMSSLFLQGRLLDLRHVCSTIVDPPRAYKNKADVIAGLGLEGVARGYLGATKYLLSGNESGLQACEEMLALANATFGEHAMLKEWSMTAMTQSLLRTLRVDCTWNVLGHIYKNNPMWTRYLMLLARGPGTPVSETASVSAIWPSQRTAIESGLFDAKNAVISMPTGAGKTRIAEIAMVHTIAQNSKAKCIYVAPYRALVAELEDSFLDVFADLGVGIYSSDGAFEDDPLQQDARIIIATPEKLDLLLRSRPEMLEHINLFIIDEAHIVASRGGRGAGMELLLARLQKKMAHSRFLFLSAVFTQSMLDEYEAWFECKKITGTWRPSRNRHAKFEWQKDMGVITYEGLKCNDVVLLTKKTYAETNSKTGRPKKFTFPPETKAGTAAALALKFSERGSVLVYAAQRKSVMSIAREIKRGVEHGYLPAPQSKCDMRSVVIAEDWLGPEHDITKLLRAGIAVHHGGIPEMLRKYVEDDLRRGRLGIVVATSTLAQGVNLPVRTVIMHSCRRYLDEKMLRIPASEYRNVAGRAGRTSYETSGTAVHIIHTAQDVADYKWYRERLGGDDERTKGELFGMLEQLKNDRLGPDWADERIDSQILAMLAEEDIDWMSEENMRSMLDASLVGIQAKNNTCALAQKFSEKAAEIYGIVKSPRLLGAYSATGLRSQSCATLEEFARMHEQFLRNVVDDPNAENVRKFLQDSIMVLGRIDEMQPREQPPGDTYGLLEAWMGGAYQNNDHDITHGFEDDPVKTAIFIEEYFGRLLPWGLSSLLRISQDVLGLGAGDIPDDMRYLPIMVKYGVPTYEAGWCMAAGMPLRRHAIKISEKYLETNDTSDHAGFTEWLCARDMDFFNEIGIDQMFIGDVLRAVSRHGRNPRLCSTLPDLFEKPVSITLSTTRRCRVGDMLELERDYDNAYDRNAITVKNKDKYVLGQLEKNTAQAVAPHIDCGDKMSAVIDAISDGAITSIKLTKAGPDSPAASTGGPD